MKIRKRLWKVESRVEKDDLRPWVGLHHEVDEDGILKRRGDDEIVSEAADRPFADLDRVGSLKFARGSFDFVLERRPSRSDTHLLNRLTRLAHRGPNYPSGRRPPAAPRCRTFRRRTRR